VVQAIIQGISEEELYRYFRDVTVFSFRFDTVHVASSFSSRLGYGIYLEELETTGDNGLVTLECEMVTGLYHWYAYHNKRSILFPQKQKRGTKKWNEAGDLYYESVYVGNLFASSDEM
jgi:hypothetical protein